MDTHTTRLLGFILAEHARVLGMQAENDAREISG